MNEIKVNKLNLNYPFSLEEVSGLFDSMKHAYKIDSVNWKEFGYKPEVDFKIVYSGNYLFLKYYVTEDYIRGVETDINSAVWDDSCVEFFCAIDNGGYYNLEINCIGTPRMEYGKTKNNRQLINADTIKGLQIHNSFGAKPIESQSGKFCWELTVIITSEVFIYHSIETWQNTTLRANFYKCGNKTTEPHFLSWNAIDASVPNFHLPQYFGKLIFD